MKMFRNSVLAFLLLAGAVAACSDESGVINLGDLTSGVTAAGMVADAYGSCSSEGCNGDLENDDIRGVSDVDAYALIYFVFWSIWNDAEFSDFESDEQYQDAIDAIPDEVEQVLTFRATDSVDCEEGTIEVTSDYRSTYTNAGEVSDVDTYYLLAVRFLNCLVEGDILDQGGTESITLNGGWVLTVDAPEEATTAHPFQMRVIGVVTLNTDDGTVAATRGEPFWTDAVNFSASTYYDGDDYRVDGGVCAGEAVSFGTREVPLPATRANDPTTDIDDECAADTDMVNDAFMSANYLIGL